MSTVQDINRALRDFERYTGDGKPNAPVGAPLPIGDPASARHNVRLAELRAVLIAMLQAEGNPEALQTLINGLDAKAEASDLSAALRDSGKIYPTRDAAVTAGQSVLTSAIGRIITMEGDDLVLRGQSIATDDPLFETAPRWGVLMRVPNSAKITDMLADFQPKGNYATAAQGGKADTAVQPAALEALAEVVGDKAEASDLAASLRDSGKIYPTRDAAVSAGQSVLTSAIGRIITMEGNDLVLRGQSIATDDPLFTSTPRWGVIMRVPNATAIGALIAPLAAKTDLDRIDLADAERPGENRSRWSATLTGAPEARPALAVGTPTATDRGAVLRVGGDDVPSPAGYIDVAPRRAYAMELGRTYRLRLGFARAVNPADPVGDAIEVRLQNLSASKAAVSNVRFGQPHSLVVADGLREVSITVSRDVEGVDYGPPATSRYLVPFLRIFGVGQQTDVVYLHWDDITDAQAGGADISGLREDLQTLDGVVGGKADKVALDATNEAVATKAADADLQQVRETAEGEIAAREALIRVSADGKTLIITDLTGHVVMRIGVEELVLMGRLVISHLTTSDFRVGDGVGFTSFRVGRDRISMFGGLIFAEFTNGSVVFKDAAGFVMLRVSPDGVWHMGQKLGGATDVSAEIAKAEFARTGILRRGPRDMPVWDMAVARVVQGVGRAVIAAPGDSNTMAWRAGPNGAHLRSRSYLAALKRRLARFNATDDNVFGQALTSNTASAYEAYDPKLVIGSSGWSPSGPASLGGAMWVNTTSTEPMRYTPDAPWDTARLLAGPEAATDITLAFQGGEAVSHTPTPGQVTVITMTAAEVGNHTLEIARLSGNGGIIGWDCYDSTRPGISIMNMGRSGWRSDQYADASEFYSPMAVFPYLDADIFFPQFGLNDWNQDKDPAVFAAEMAELVDASHAAGADAALIIPMNPNGTKAYPWEAMRSAVLSVSDAKTVPVMDFGAKLGPYAEAFALGTLYDNLHPNGLGYGVCSSLPETLLFC